MNATLKNSPSMRFILIAGVFLVAIFGMLSLNAKPAGAWDTTESVATECTKQLDGCVVIKGTQVNNEGAPAKGKPKNWNDMRVVMETPYGNSDEVIVLADGTPANFTFNTGLREIPEGNVVFVRYWANPHRGGAPDPTDPVHYDALKCKTSPKAKVTGGVVTKSIPPRTYPGKWWTAKITAKFTGKHFGNLRAKVVLVDNLPKGMIGKNNAKRLGTIRYNVKPGQVIKWNPQFRMTPYAMYKNITNCVTMYVYVHGKLVLIRKACDTTYDPPKGT